MNRITSITAGLAIALSMGAATSANAAVTADRPSDRAATMRLAEPIDPAATVATAPGVTSADAGSVEPTGLASPLPSPPTALPAPDWDRDVRACMNGWKSVVGRTTCLSKLAGKYVPW